MARRYFREAKLEPHLTVSAKLFRFFFSFASFIDLTAIIPFCIVLINGNDGSSTSTTFIRMFRILRIFKVAKGYSDVLRVFQKTFEDSKSALMLLFFIIFMVVIIISCIEFELEGGDFTVNENYPNGAFLRTVDGFGTRELTPFDSVSTTIYWAIITLTTLGYGGFYADDVYHVGSLKHSRFNVPCFLGLQVICFR